MDLAELVAHKMGVLGIANWDELVERAKAKRYTLHKSQISKLCAGTIFLSDQTWLGLAAAIEEHPLVVLVAFATTKKQAPSGFAELVAEALHSPLAGELAVERERVYSTKARSLQEIGDIVAKAHHVIEEQKAELAAFASARRPVRAEAPMPGPRATAKPVFQPAGECAGAER